MRNKFRINPRILWIRQGENIGVKIYISEAREGEREIKTDLPYKIIIVCEKRKDIETILMW